MLPSVAEKLISTNPCSGLECKEQQEKLLTPRNKKSVAMAKLVARCAEKLISSSLCRGMENKDPIKYLQVEETEKSVAMATLIASYR